MRKKVCCKAASGGDGRRPRSTAVFLIALVAVGSIVLAAHWPVLSARALMLDDNHYIVKNQLVQNPSLASAKRFLTEIFEPSSVGGYYHPLAMISLMLDVAMGGSVDNLKTFHLTSLFLHVANSLLVAVFLYLLFGRVLPAAMMGLLYGVHPITIESVAWVSERKTLLAAFFALWCLIFYIRFIRKHHWSSGAVCLIMYVLSILSKPSTIGMPILLLLLDWWPLRRFSKKAVLEKLPLFIVAGLAAVITFVSQSRSASVTLPSESGPVRILLIFCHNIIFYLKNIIWPVKLSWYYPFPEPFNLSQPQVIVGAIGTCALIAVLLISLRWTRCLLMGWLFFFAAIFPTLGLVGFHPMIAADRHMYFPIIGLLLPAGWLFGQFWGGEHIRFSRVTRQIILVAAVALLTVSEFVLTRSYLVYWRDTESVYKYMLKLSPDVAILHSDLGLVLNNSGKVDEAIEHFNKALKLVPNFAEAHSNLGCALRKLGKTDEEILHYRKALELKPNSVIAHYNLATALAEQGKTDEAIAEYRQALRLEPENSDALSNLGFALAEQGNFSEAIECYKKVLQLEPGNILTHGRLGLAMAGAGKIDEAIKEFRIVLTARPDDAEVCRDLGRLLEKKGEIAEAIKSYRAAMQIDPNTTNVRKLLENALQKQRNQP